MLVVEFNHLSKQSLTGRRMLKICQPYFLQSIIYIYIYMCSLLILLIAPLVMKELELKEHGRGTVRQQTEPADFSYFHSCLSWIWLHIIWYSCNRLSLINLNTMIEPDFVQNKIVYLCTVCIYIFISLCIYIYIYVFKCI